MLIDLADADVATAGGKAAVLGRLLHAGLPVPPGFVVPTTAYEQAVTALGTDDAGATRRLLAETALPSGLADRIEQALDRLGDPPVAVRSSATSEDTADATAAGQHDTFLGVSGAPAVADAVRRCWASVWSERAVAYRRRTDAGPPGVAVLVQELVDAEVAGVLFTGTDIRVEGSWGLGESVVAGRVTPDSWTVSGDAVVNHVLGGKATRVDRQGDTVVTREVDGADRERPCLSGEDVLRLARLGREVAKLLQQPQDIEWAYARGLIWLLQARPITSPLPGPVTGAEADTTVLTGTPGSAGIARGPVRVVRGVGDFGRVRSGDILVCRTTDPAWTPLFGTVAAVITETGGVLSHAAIVAREQGLPAVLAVAGATNALPDDAPVEVDGSTGRITLL
ncbi:PEP/pyruvate-binding domain-containing protein [Actinoplanes sp. NPDC051851]|uniref:PEP/pyruvate-binding domain-containing protein n=1 Tax=Actinoplanes sp. NPDC051851 TaxID=3154753 RepID=UPI003414B6E2